MEIMASEKNFVDRHIGPNDSEIQQQLSFLGLKNLEELVAKAAPQSVLTAADIKLGNEEGRGLTEEQLLRRAWSLASANQVFKSFMGQGYYGTATPRVIQRNILENPAWYTAYTPYQAEISQGRMEALLNFQTMVAELTGMEIANASLLDEGTAAAEAMSLCWGSSAKTEGHPLFLVAADCLTQTKEVVRTRAEAVGIEVKEVAPSAMTFEARPFALLLQYPGADGGVHDYTDLVKEAQKNGCRVIVAADPLALCFLRPPGEWGADVVVGSTQRFGVPMGFGGPHAAFLATRESFKRQIPGRIIGVSQDSAGDPALRLALQTREQHIRREKATSNICTAQVLLAVMASMYTVYHGPENLRRIALNVHRKALALAEGLRRLGFRLKHNNFFDTLVVEVPAGEAVRIHERARASRFNLAEWSTHQVGVALDETTEVADLDQLLGVFAPSAPQPKAHFNMADALATVKETLPGPIVRQGPCLRHPIFSRYHSETELLRYIRRLEQKDLSLVHAMIPLGSCTMKLNATTEMIPVTWPEFSDIHPFAPAEQTRGYRELIGELESWLAEITGFSAVSLQPNAGSQGEFAGLLVIRAYHLSRGEADRRICLIPQSAHGTNPASAVMAGFKVVVVGCDDQGNVDLTDLKMKVQQHGPRLAALMITYPSTHGVFEEGVREICQMVHAQGGLVYMDGANMNALVGVARPGEFGPDVCHLNLHKTFCIPHGGGGPGIGPIAVAAHLKAFLPSHSVVPACGPEATGIGAVAAAPWGSAGILPISWAYVAMMGASGLKKATQVAILNANYIARRLDPHFPVLYRSESGWVAHECILDLRAFRDSVGITVDDVAKRLMDYGFHAPTMSWPVAGTLMIEPTESESKEELDRFCEAMIAIREEIREVESGRADRENNVLKNAPHSYRVLTADEWSYSYSRQKAGFPLPWLRERKFWVPVGRVDNAYGDRHLVCSCPPPSDY